LSVNKACQKMICQNESEQNIDDNKLSEDSDLPFCMIRQNTDLIFQ
jgi:hypothetical protein